MIDTDGKYYLGGLVDPQSGEATNETLLYDPEDLTTHCVVVGMTGSGKTGLCIDMLEEAGLNQIPALMIDPKGDITNTLLHFPDLLPEDFQPWINESEARREGQTPEEAAEKTAALWRDGLAGWDIGGDRLQTLKDSVPFTVYTPGSTAGVPLSVLSSLEAPALPWEDNEEVLRGRISGTVTALLGLVGVKDIDPVQSREHILLANLFENAWSNGRDLTLGELILQIQTPPFEKLGVFDVNTFYPEKDRFNLAMRMNSILAAPSFQAWIEGEPLDIQRLLYGNDGRPRHSVFYIAHLSDEERMFFVTLLYSAVETWMRSQSGTTSLRALVYFDEIFGYLPPVGNPPSKEPMLRMFKQARAFGVGMVVATQNPVDIDYKGLSNAGTWFIGKLATDQDKSRLLDGLSSVASGALDRREYDRLISAIGKRVFVMRNIHDKQPSLFQTRWAMNYLAGPMTRSQIPALNELAGAAVPEQAAPAKAKPPRAKTAAPTVAAAATSATRPAAPSGIDEYILPVTLSADEALEQAGLEADEDDVTLTYQPALLLQADVKFARASYDVNTLVQQTALVTDPDSKGVIRWEDYLVRAIDVGDLETKPAEGGRFSPIERPLSDAKQLRGLRTEYKDWVYNNLSLPVRANKTLKIYAGPDVSDEIFGEMLEEAAEDKLEADVEKMKARYKSKIKSYQTKLAREERELQEDQAELSGRKQEEWFKHAETLLGFLGKSRRSLSSSMTKRRLTAKAKADVEESEEAIVEYQEEIAELQEEMTAELAEVEEKWAGIMEDITEIPLTPAKSKIRVDMFGVAWLPTWLIEDGDDVVAVPAFQA